MFPSCSGSPPHWDDRGQAPSHKRPECFCRAARHSYTGPGNYRIRRGVFMLWATSG
jgi:hypothetical protein